METKLTSRRIVVAITEAEFAELQLIRSRRSDAKEARRLRVHWKLEQLAIDPRCAYCVRDITRFSATVDHIMPSCLGGLDAPENWALACGGCGGSKGDSTLAEWRDRLMSGLLFRGFRLVCETESVSA